MNNNKKDFWVIVAFDQKQEGYILDQSNDCIDADLINEVTADDCGIKFFEHGKQIYPSMSVMKFKLKPWAHHDNMNGEYDCGIDCERINTFWRLND